MASSLEFLQFFWLLQLLLVSFTNAQDLEQKQDQPLTVMMGIAAALALVVGLYLCFVGYRFFRQTLLMCGFLFGGLMAAGITKLIAHDNQLATWLAFLCGGILFGLLVFCVNQSGIFLVGATAGLLFAILINTSVAHRLHPSHPHLTLLILIVVFSLIGGMITCITERTALIGCMSYIGAFLAFMGLGMFIGNYPSDFTLDAYSYKDSQGIWRVQINPAWWCYFGATLVLFAIGTFVQLKKTSRDIDHTLKEQDKERSCGTEGDLENGWSTSRSTTMPTPMPRPTPRTVYAHHPMSASYSCYV